ncbi:uncharacterized protein METZ01_LOCUS105632 [marine metagenome]|uniref:Uncharacterized protein n=1 Tax=marine metagenome TaxID=408172 RepID=A0A381WKU2_9ZZZZ
MTGQASTGKKIIEMQVESPIPISVSTLWKRV